MLRLTDAEHARLPTMLRDIVDLDRKLDAHAAELRAGTVRPLFDDDATKDLKLDRKRLRLSVERFYGTRADSAGGPRHA